MTAFIAALYRKHERAAVARYCANSVTAGGHLAYGAVGGDKIEPPRHRGAGSGFVRSSYFVIPTWLSSHAYSKAVSCRRSYRPLAPPWPAGSILTLSSSGLESVFKVRSRATHLAGSQYITWLSSRRAVTSMAG